MNNKDVIQHYQYEQATGALKYTLTNDYLFRMVLQRDNETLIMLICSVLHLSRDQVIDATIDNPIEPGKSIAIIMHFLQCVTKAENRRKRRFATCNFTRDAISCILG